MSRSVNAKWVILTLMLTIMIDVMGGGLVFPLFPRLFLDANSILMPNTASLAVRHTYYAIAMGVWPLGIFFGTPYWGAMSDQSGRKKMLVACLFGEAVTYVLGGMALEVGSVWLFIISRLIAGFFAGSFALAQTAIADVSLPEEKARNMSWITLALSIGLVVGPFITSLTALPEFAAVFSSSSPFWFAAILSCLNIASIMALLHETMNKKNAVSISPLKALTSVSFIFTDTRLRALAWVSLGVQMGWGFYILTIPLFLAQRFNLSTHQIGLFFSVLGVSLMITQLFIQPKLFKRFKLESLFIVGAVMCGLSFTVGYLFPYLPVHWIVMISGSIFDLLNYSSLMAICSNSVSENEQGKLMGGAGAIFGLSWIIISTMLAPIVNFNIVLPFVLAGACFWVGGFLMVLKHNRAKLKQETV